MKVLIIGHACSPSQGSEPGFTWNWAVHLAEEHDVWVLTYPKDRTAIEEHLRDGSRRYPRFVWLEGMPRRLDPWKPERGERFIRLHYMVWQRRALSLARLLVKQKGIDIVHFVSWGTVGAPPALWRLPVPFVWGPVGGGQSAPSRFAACFGRTWWKERARRLRLIAMPYTPSLRRLARGNGLLLATNRETAAILTAAGAPNVQLMSDGGLPDHLVSSEVPRRTARPVSAEQPFDLLWAGRLEHRKGLPLALDMMKRLSDLPVRLLVAGGGPQGAEWGALARPLGPRVQFLGPLAHDRLTALFGEADAFLFTSLRDSLGTVVLEAMGAGLPLVSLDHQGVGALVPGSAAIKVPVTEPAETVERLAEAVRQLVVDPSRRDALAEAALAYARTVTWSQRADRMTQHYKELIEHDGHRSSVYLPSPV